jgi:hypothetical protein
MAHAAEKRHGGIDDGLSSSEPTRLLFVEIGKTIVEVIEFAWLST